MPTETFELVVPMKGFSTDDTFVVKGTNATHVQLVSSRRPESVMSITKEAFEGSFRRITA